MFRTEIKPIESPNKISYASRLLLMGSCFSSNIGKRFKELKFNATDNPFGIIYNPLSIAKILESSLSSSSLEMRERNGYRYSYLVHSDLCGYDKESVSYNMDKALTTCRDEVLNTDFLFITLGTAYVYQLKESGEVVANCHKVPSSNFTHRLLEVDEIVQSLVEVLKTLKLQNPKLQVVFTVSPVRHWKDGPENNQISKSTLRLSISKLEQQVDFVSYFPSYEIVMDDLRDYRFYEKDMLHPNQVAIDYIWDKLKSAFILPETQQLMDKVEMLRKSVNHRPFNPTAEAHQSFVKKLLIQLNDFSRSYPMIDLSNEIDAVKEQLQ